MASLPCQNMSLILTANREVASLNEFRKFFGLKTHDTFESINPDPEISDLLRKLYDSPDMVELYPGLFVEDAKPRMDPGSGFQAPYTVGRAVLSDAVTLVRGDRFNTLVSGCWNTYIFWMLKRTDRITQSQH